jgi:hypothetical protein
MKSPAQDLLGLPPFGLAQAEKDAALFSALDSLTRHHYRNCDTYRNIVDRIFGGLREAAPTSLEDVPFLPVSLFKTHALKSVPDAEIFKVLTSSGTTGQSVSRVFLDAETARIQSAVLVKITQHFVGKDRLPMVILDHEGVVRDRRAHSARGAGILGMAQFGRRPFYALREDMSLDERGLLEYLSAAGHGKILLFGFTFMVWASFLDALEARRLSLDLPDAILIHTGGWKRLRDLTVSPEAFRQRVKALTGIRSVINFYGMAEQVGGVYFENELHYLHAPIYSDVIIRDPVTLAPVPDGETGLIQVLSSLPVSYPGHSILTEDLGVIRGCDVPGLTMKGRCFEMLGRVPESELRGCSDTFQPARVDAR